MLRFTLTRVGLIIPILLGVSIIVFLLMEILPGDPAAALLSNEATDAEREAVREQLGLNDPLVVRYFNWLTDALTGDFGYSEYRRAEVSDLLLQAWGNTAVLALFSAVFGLAMGIWIGFVAGTHRGKVVDRVVSVISLSGLSIPSFFVAILMLLFFAAQLRWLPAGGLGVEPGIGTFVEHLIMPMIAGSLITMAITARVTRASIVDVYSSDFVETLRVKGLRNGQVLRHVLKNAISPVLTTSGVQIGALLGGSVLVETIFRWPGMGLLVFNAITARDLKVVQGATLVIACTFVLINLLVDIAQAVVDPRLRRARA